MKPQDQQQQPQPFERIRFGMVATLFVAKSIAFPSEMMLRNPRTFGVRYFGIQALAGLVNIPLWMLFWPGASPLCLILFGLAVLAMMAYTRARMVMRREHRPMFHSRYSGQPRLARVFGIHREQAIKCVAEPLAVFLTGGLVSTLDAPLGTYLMASAAGLWASANIIEAVIRARVVDLNDQMLENREVFDRWETLRRKQRW